MIPWLDAKDPFPPVSRALTEPNGLLAAGREQAIGVFQRPLDRRKRIPSFEPR